MRTQSSLSHKSTGLVNLASTNIVNHAGDLYTIWADLGYLREIDRITRAMDRHATTNDNSSTSKFFFLCFLKLQWNFDVRSCFGRTKLEGWVLTMFFLILHRRDFFHCLWSTPIVSPLKYIFIEWELLNECATLPKCSWIQRAISEES